MTRKTFLRNSVVDQQCLNIQTAVTYSICDGTVYALRTFPGKSLSRKDDSRKEFPGKTFPG